MGFAETLLPRQALDALAKQYPGIRGATRCCPPERLHGGEESAAYRLGQFVIRIGPPWRTAAESEWCHAVVAAAATQVPQALAPTRSADGRTVLVIGGRPLSVWPFIAGRWADRNNAQHVVAAAHLLARLHTALASTVLAERPPSTAALGDASDLADPGLDAWLGWFDRTHRDRQPVHGDYYPGNVLARGDQLAAVLDWDEAYLGPPERELAVAAWEWGGGLKTGQLANARRFVATYREAGGPASALDESALRQLIRQRLRWEIRYQRAQANPAICAVENSQYTKAQVTAYWELRPDQT